MPTVCRIVVSLNSKFHPDGKRCSGSGCSCASAGGQTRASHGHDPAVLQMRRWRYMAYRRGADQVGACRRRTSSPVVSALVRTYGCDCLAPGELEGAPVLRWGGAAGAGEVAPQCVGAAEPAAGRYRGDRLVAALQQPLGEHDALSSEPEAGGCSHLLAKAPGEGARRHRRAGCQGFDGDGLVEVLLRPLQGLRQLVGMAALRNAHLNVL